MWENRRNYQLKVDRLLGDLYRLATLFAADSRLMQPGSDEGSDALRYLRNRLLEDDVAQLLISIAAASRIQAEHMSGLRADEAELSFSPVIGACGRLWPDASRDVQTELSLREACNKIVHALNISIRTQGEEESSAALPVIYLDGSLGKKQWRCELDVYDFIATCVRNLDVMA